jgi:hypothetical protein
VRKPLFRVAIVVAIVCVVLAPALIWSGQRPELPKEPANVDQDVFKGPLFFTVGPPMTPEELAAREQEKFLSILEGEARARESLEATRRFQTPPSDAPPEAIRFPEAPDLPATGHPGLTAAELEKLAAIRSGALKPRGNPGVWGPKPEMKLPTYDAPLRPLGFDGLTPEEKAKLEASRVRDGKAAGDEGGRSR